jgi:hypothetical protein
MKPFNLVAASSGLRIEGVCSVKTKHVCDLACWCDMDAQALMMSYNLASAKRNTVISDDRPNTDLLESWGFIFGYSVRSLSVIWPFVDDSTVK